MPNKKILKLSSSVNIADDIRDAKKLAEISDKVVQQFEEDASSLDSWRRKAECAIKLAGMEGLGNKTDGIKSDIKSPLVSRACINFTSNTVPEFIRDGKVCKAKIYGTDPDGQKQERAKRELQYLNYLLLNPNSAWQESFEKTLTQLACTGMSFRKAVYDPRTKEVKTIFLSYDEVFIHNKCKSLEPSDCRAVTHKYNMHQNDLVSLERQGVFSNIPEPEDSDSTEERDGYHEILEQHCFLDLDEDGYEEPYIVYLHRSSNTILRIVARYTIEDVIYNEKDEVVEIIPESYFIPYVYLPSFNGDFFGLGIGTLLTPMTASFDTSLNQLIDAGRYANEATYVADKSINYKNKEMRIKQGRVNIIDGGGMDISKVIQKFDMGEPSPVLFQLAQYLDQFAKELSTTTDAMTGGSMPSNMKTGAANLMVERGMKVFNAIHKRTFKSVTTELNIIYRLLHRYEDIEKYAIVLDQPIEQIQNDFSLSDLDVLPIADPNMASEADRSMRAEFLLQFTQDPRMPEENIFNIYREAAESRGFENVDRFIPDVQNAKEDPAVTQMKQEAQQQLEEVEKARQELEIERQKQQIEIYKAQLQAETKQQELSQKEQDSIRQHIREILNTEVKAQIEERKIESAKRKTESGSN